MHRRVVLLILRMLLLQQFSAAFESPFKEAEKYPEFWREKARENLRISLKKLTVNNKPAKNVILFIGDGMDVSTMTAGRILKGQRWGVSGEEGSTSLDRFPHVGLSKVYTLDRQTPDSAGTATALLTGVKSITKTLGMSGKTDHSNCESGFGNEVKTILENSADVGKATGIVTTTHVLHATPASAYAHIPDRSWLTDAELSPEANRMGCKDIGAQLIEQGKKINVLLGGGRAFMRPIGYEDEEYGLSKDMENGRADDRDLIEEWKALHSPGTAKYVWNLDGFRDVAPRQVEYLMGLFDTKHMKYEHEREDDKGGEPSLAEMTEKALRILRKNENGYFLLVEGGRIDHGHHDTRANVALSEFLAFDDAVETAMRMTSEEDTLIVVTADHGHMFNMGGYSVRGNPVDGFAEDHDNPLLARDGLKFTSIAYGNGAEWLGNQGNKRKVLSESMTKDISFRYPNAIPLQAETHSATDVAVLARGPMSHLFGGIVEQNYIGYAMMYASCVGEDRRHCRVQGRYKSWECPSQEEINVRKKKIKKFQGVSSAMIRADAQRALNRDLPWWCTAEPQSEWITPVEMTTKATPTIDYPENTMYKPYGTRPPMGRESDEIENVRERPITNTAPKRKSWNTTPAPTTNSKRKNMRPTFGPAGTKAMKGSRQTAATHRTKDNQWKRGTPRPKKARPTTAARGKTVSKNHGTQRPKNQKHRTTTYRPVVSGRRGTPKPRNVQETTAPLRSKTRNRGTPVPKKRGTTTVRKNTATSRPNRMKPTTATSKKQHNNKNQRPTGYKGQKYSRYGSTRPNLNKRRPTQAPHRVFRRELTTEDAATYRYVSTERHYMGEQGTPEAEMDDDDEYGVPFIPEADSRPDPTEQSDTDLTYTAKIVESSQAASRITRNQQKYASADVARDTKSPRERFLDQIAEAIRAELEHINVYSNKNDFATLDLSIKVSPTYNGDDKGYESTPSEGDTEPMVVCMQWSSDAGMVALGPNSSEIAFIYDEDNPHFQKQDSNLTSEEENNGTRTGKAAKIATLGSDKVATGGSNQSTVVVLLSILTVAFFLLSVALFYMYHKRSQMLREEINSRERERKAAVLSKVRLEDVREEEIPREEYSRGNDNNNSNVSRLEKACLAARNVSRWCGHAHDARSIRKTRRISTIDTS